MDSLQREESGGKTEIVMRNYLVLNEVTGSNNTSDNSLLLSSYYVPDSYNALVMLTHLIFTKTKSRHYFYSHFTTEETEA